MGNKVKIGMLSEIMEQGGSLLKQTAKAVVSAPTDLTKAAVSQVSGSAVPGQGSNEHASGSNPAGDTASQQNKDFVRELYGKKPKGQQNQPPPQTTTGVTGQLGVEKKSTPEEEQKIAQLRQQLHSQYYQPLANPAKQQEERSAEKVEREKMQDLQVQQEKEAKKPQNLAAQRASQSTEKFRGASG